MTMQLLRTALVAASRKLVMLCLLCAPMGTVLADFGSILDLEVAVSTDTLEGHYDLFTSPSSGPQFFENDVNDLSIPGNDLWLDHQFTQVSPSVLEFDVTVFADPGELLFTNLPGAQEEVVHFGFDELDLGGAYTFNSASFQVGTSGIFSTINESNVFLEGNGDVASLMLLEFDFNASDFNGADTLTVSVSFTAVPIPAAVWLFGSGLLGLVGFARRKAS